MLKRVLIIANDDPGIGSQIDLENYERFFKGINGGAWLDNEIITLPAPTKEQLVQAIREHQLHEVDYLIVIFSGHGAYDPDTDRTILCLRGKTNNPDHLIYDTDINAIAEKQLTIIDSCRFWGPTNNQEMLKESCVSCSTANLFALSRIAYENQINNVQAGHLTLYACQARQTTFGDSASGGEFTQALLDRDFIKTVTRPTTSMYFSIIHALWAAQILHPDNQPQKEGNAHLGALPWILN